jgi:hypothetical protein
MEASSESLQCRKPGTSGKDLMPLLGGFLWQHQQLPNRLLVSGKKYFWWLPCNKHLRWISVQAAARQVAECEHDAPKQLHACERCGSTYRTFGPEPDASDVHRSYYEQCCWLYLEHVLDMPEVKHGMQASAPSAPSGCNMLIGADIGYVVEARVVAGWNAGVDVYVPALKLVVQVDGEHHESAEKQEADAQFIHVAHEQHFHVLRLWYADMYTMPQDLLDMVHKCMHHAVGSPAIVMCTRSHPLCTHHVYQTIKACSMV